MQHFFSHERCHACPDRVVCHCLQVLESQVVETLNTHEIRNLRELRRATGAGDGCTCCHDQLRMLIETHTCVPCG